MSFGLRFIGFGRGVIWFFTIDIVRRLTRGATIAGVRTFIDQLSAGVQPVARGIQPGERLWTAGQTRGQCRNKINPEKRSRRASQTAAHKRERGGVAEIQNLPAPQHVPLVSLAGPFEEKSIRCSITMHGKERL
jgi:hypothetical protein